MNKKTSLSLKKRILFSFLAFVIVLLPAFYIANRYCAGLLENSSLAHAKYELKVVHSDGKAGYLICHIKGGDSHYDYVFQHVMPVFRDFINIGRIDLDTDEPLKCVHHPFDATEMNRNFPDPGRAEPREKRVVFIGDSFTYGEAVPTGMAYPDYLDHYLALSGNPQNTRVLNYGIVGADFPFLYEENFKAALAAQPRMIVYSWIPNDTPYPGQRDAALEIYDMINRRGDIRRFEGFPLLRVLRIAAFNRRITARTIEWYRDIHSDFNSEGLESMQQMLAAMKRESEAAGAEFRVALFPLLAGGPDGYPFQGIHSVMSGMLDREGIPWIDLTSTLLETRAEDLWINAANHHPNALGHRKAARALVRFLELAGDDSINAMGRSQPGAAGCADTGCGDGCASACMGARDWTGICPAMKEETAWLPEDISWFTNSVVVRNALRNAGAGVSLMDAHAQNGTLPPGDGRPAVFAIFAPSDSQLLKYLAMGRPPAVSVLSFPTGSLLFFTRDELASIDTKMITFEKELCE